MWRWLHKEMTLLIPSCAPSYKGQAKYFITYTNYHCRKVSWSVYWTRNNQQQQLEAVAWVNGSIDQYLGIQMTYDKVRYQSFPSHHLAVIVNGFCLMPISSRLLARLYLDGCILHPSHSTRSHHGPYSLQLLHLYHNLLYHHQNLTLHHGQL